MYVEEIVAKRNGKEYRTFLVRQSIRVGSVVNHKTIANISHLPIGCIEAIKRYLKGSANAADPSQQVQVINSKEHGASETVLSFARKLKMDTLIFSRKVQWREDALAMIVGRLLYPGNELTLTNMHEITVLWESCGHFSGTQPDICTTCYECLYQLHSRQGVIQKKLEDRHLGQDTIALLFLTSTIIEEVKENDDFASFKTDNGCKQKYQEFNTILLTNFEGCPIAVQTFPISPTDQRRIQEYITNITNRFPNMSFIVIGDHELQTRDIDEEIANITALSQLQISLLVERNIISPSLFTSENFQEVTDPSNSSLRYILCLNEKRKKE